MELACQRFVIAYLCIWIANGAPCSAVELSIHPPGGSYSTSWIGNSFPGDGGANGQGFWIQNGADEIEVTPDGTVFAGTDWDEAGRCVGLYKDGQPNQILLKQESTKETAWGWNTGNEALAVHGENIYIANSGKRLLRFTWNPGDLNSAKFVEEFEMPEKAIGLAATADQLAVAYANKVELRKTADFSLLTERSVTKVKDVIFAPDKSLWLIVDQKVQQLKLNSTGELDSALGKENNVNTDKRHLSLCPEVAIPTALSLDNQGRLLVCDDGPDQQVKFYDLSGDKPQLVACFGEKGGILSGTPGESAPQKLYAPRGAGTDAAGNLYVALGFNGAPVGTLVLRSFTPEGKLRWEAANHAFVDTFCFDPESDGRTVYGRTAIFDLDLEQTNSALLWRQRATTIDHVNFPTDPRVNSGMSTGLRYVGGRRLLYAIGQYGGGYRLFAFADELQSHIAHPVGHVTAPGETWAWHIATNGDIWCGDAPNRTIRRHAFRGWRNDGKPGFETVQPDAWPLPDDFDHVRRVIYDDSVDALYLSGYLKDEVIDSWGVTGKTLRRINGWLEGDQSVAWTIKLPVNPEGEGPRKPLSPSSLSLAGDYMFVGMVKPEHGKQYVHILRAADGAYVGSLSPGAEVGGNAGWLDMPYAVNAMLRKNGEYLILVEEDWRGKNILYRWKP